MLILGFVSTHDVNKDEEDHLKKIGFIRWPTLVHTWHVGIRIDESVSFEYINEKVHTVFADLNMEPKDVSLLISED